MSVIYLRPTAEADLDYVLAAECHPDNRPFVGQWTREQHQEAIQNDQMAHWIVTDHAQHSVGYLVLNALRSADRNLEFQRLVITEKSRGYGQAALQEAIRLVFEVYGAHRLWLDVMDTNVGARHLYQAAGFVEEGVLRECLYYTEDDCFRSLVVMGMLEQEYRR